MTLRYVFLVSFIACITMGQAMAQSAPKSKIPGFRSINTIGILAGQAGNAFEAQSVNGLEYRNWFAGLGLGLDYYEFRSVPFFFDLRRMFGNSPSRWFVYGDAGTLFPFAIQGENKLYQGHFQQGFYADAGFGREWMLGKKLGLSFSAGYRYKTARETATGNACPIAGTCNPASDYLTYRLNSISFRAGLIF